MVKKSFFAKRTPEKISKLNIRQISHGRELTAKITDLNPETEALQLMFPLIHPSFMRRDRSQAEASRKQYKHGHLINVPQPETRMQAHEYPYTPLLARMQAFENAFKNLKEHEIFTVGYQWQPVQGNDRRWRVVPFDVCLEGAKIYNYAVNNASGIPISPFDKAKIVEKEGAQIDLTVPSRTKGHQRYEIMFKHIPIANSPSKNAIILSIGSSFNGQGAPGRKTFLHELRYQFLDEGKGSDVHVFTPHEIAGYHAIVRHFWQGLENTVPLEMNPFCLPSREEARFYDKLNNNILIFDPTLSGKTKLRNLHVDEISVLLARSIKAKGSYETMFWDPLRDKKFSQYWA